MKKKWWIGKYVKFVVKLIGNDGEIWGERLFGYVGIYEIWNGSRKEVLRVYFGCIEGVW